MKIFEKTPAGGPRAAGDGRHGPRSPAVHALHARCGHRPVPSALHYSPRAASPDAVRRCVWARARAPGTMPGATFGQRRHRRRASPGVWATSKRHGGRASSRRTRDGAASSTSSSALRSACSCSGTRLAPALVAVERLTGVSARRTPRSVQRIVPSYARVPSVRARR